MLGGRESAPRIGSGNGVAGCTPVADSTQETLSAFFVRSARV